jgi:hypothetical protein
VALLLVQRDVAEPPASLREVPLLEVPPREVLRRREVPLQGLPWRAPEAARPGAQTVAPLEHPDAAGRQVPAPMVRPRLQARPGRQASRTEEETRAAERQVALLASAELRTVLVSVTHRSTAPVRLAAAERRASLRALRRTVAPRAERMPAEPPGVEQVELRPALAAARAVVPQRPRARQEQQVRRPVERMGVASPRVPKARPAV